MSENAITTVNSRAVRAPRVKPAKSPVTEYVHKEELPDGRVIWVHPETAEEITLNGGAVPTADVLAMLAANGIVPSVPTLEDFNDRQQLDRESFPQLDDEPDSALSRVITRLKGAPGETRAEVRIYKVGADGKDAYCAKVTIEEYDELGEELIRAHWGAGKYRVRVYGPSFNQDSNYGKFVRLSNELVEIVPGTMPVKVPGAESGAMNPAMEMIMRKLEQLENRVQQPAVDPLAQFAQFATLFKTISGGGGKQNSLAENVKEMVMLQKFMKDLGAEKDTSEGDDSLMGTVKTMLPTLMQAIQNRGQGTPVNPAFVPEPVLPLGLTAAPQPTESETVNPIQALVLSGMIAAYVKAAMEGQPVEKHAEEIAEKMPDEFIEVLDTSAWFEVLCEFAPQHAPALNQYKPWFTALRDRVLDLVMEPDDDGNGEVAEPTTAPAPAPVVAPPVAPRKRTK